ncbi:MAG: hypothetical protein Q9187_006633, partial [Circinaria calcarea]
MPPKHMPQLRNISEAPSGSQVSQVSRKSKDKQKLRIVSSNHMGFLEGLRNRNVDFDASRDTDGSISALVLGECPSSTTEEQEKNWQMDMEECQRSGEATFQRTIMMEIINRHKLGDYLKYSCESTWTCQPMPRTISKDFDRMTMPTPDLAVSFKTSALIDALRLNRLSQWMSLICPESLKENKVDRAFHFFSLEAKNAQMASQSNVALRQNFNVASLALHNMYMVMRKANMEDVFFKDVRFFSATATSSGFH